MKLIIDDHLDTITRFTKISPTYDTKLTWFQNGAFRDIKLIYKGRILKVYTNINENDLFSIISDAETVLFKYLTIY
jgi:hypothetical protein